MSPEGWVMIIGAVFFGVGGVVNSFFTWIDRRDSRKRDELAAERQQVAAAAAEKAAELQKIAVSKAEKVDDKIDRIGNQTDGALSAMKAQNEELTATNRRLENLLTTLTVAQATGNPVMVSTPAPAVVPAVALTPEGLVKVEVVASKENPIPVELPVNPEEVKNP